MQSGNKLIRAEVSDAAIIAFIEALPYGQIRQIVNSLLQKAVTSVAEGTITRGALLDGNFRISNCS